MNNSSDNASSVFMDLAVEKIDAQDKRITEMENDISQIPGYAKQIEQLINTVEEIKTVINAVQFPTEMLQDFSTRLALAVSLLDQPVKNKVQHHHYVPKLIWIAAGLFIALSLVCSGWYMTREKLDGYIINDTKYRYLRLDTANIRLGKDLALVDSLYEATPDLRNIVTDREEQNKKNLELLQRARLMESEAGELKRKVFTK